MSAFILKGIRLIRVEKFTPRPTWRGNTGHVETEKGWFPLKSLILGREKAKAKLRERLNQRAEMHAAYANELRNRAISKNTK